MATPAWQSALKEATDSNSPSSSSMTFRGARDTIEYHLRKEDGPWSQQYLNDLQRRILGSTKTQNTSTTHGGLNRTLPLAHPTYMYRYATDMDVRGCGTPLVTSDPFNEYPPLQQVTAAKTVLYPEYSIRVTFGPRLYNLLPNTAITLFNGQSTADNAQGAWFDVTDGTEQNFFYANEWLRFTDFEVTPKDDYETAQMGAGMQFKYISGVARSPFAGMPRVRLPNQLLKVTWYQIPYRYVTSQNSYIAKWPGFVNQNDWFNWSAGQLLYVTYNPIRYQHPRPELISVGANIQSPAKLIDLELFFLLTNRTTTDEVPGGAGSIGTRKGNNIAAGHNLLPWYKDRGFHYATDDDGNAFWRSFPMEILFWDPDLPHLGGL